MAFVEDAGTIVSFAEFTDVINMDQRLFEANEGLSDTVIDEQLVRATDRILQWIRSSAWWKKYYTQRNTSITILTVADIPAVDPDKILARQSDFTELCVYVALSDYVLPSIADFGNEDSAERQKMGYYKQRASELFAEIISAGDWYDFDGDSTIQSDEKDPEPYNLKRVR